MIKPKAIPYQRFSSLIQGKGSTLDRQQKYINEWLLNHPEVELSKIAPIDKGRSAFKGEHLDHGFGLILKAIENGEITAGDYILVEAIDRIGRLEPMKMLSLLQSILGSGVTIVTLGTPTVEYTEKAINSDMKDLFLLVAKVIQAHEYSKALSQRIFAAYERKRQQARNGESIKKSTPIWLTSDGKLIPENAKAVREVIELYLNGRGTKWILEHLSNKYPFLKSVHPTTPKRWFSNKAIIGEWHSRGEIIPNVFEPLIDIFTFRKLQEQIKRNYKQMSEPTSYILAGLVICKKCKKRYHIRRKKHNETVILYMNCSTYLKRGKSHCNNNKTLPYEFLKFIFDYTSKNYLINICDDLAKDTSNKKALEIQHQIQNLEEQFNRQNEVYVEFMQPSTKEKMRAIVDEKDALIKEYENLITANTTYSVSFPLITDPYEFADLGSDDESYLFHNDDSFNLYKQLMKDDKLINNALLKSTYRIYALDSTAQVIGDETATLKLYKRSQQHSCYLADFNVSYPENICELTSETLNKLPDVNLKVAINRDGLDFREFDCNWHEFNKRLTKYLQDT